MLSEECPTLLAFTSESSTSDDDESAIAELQTAFPTILTLSRDKMKPSRPSPRQPWNEVLLQNRADREAEFAYVYPKWTGSFDILAFPRELRDTIYFHYLYRSKALVWRRRQNHGYERRDWVGFIAIYNPNIDLATLNLFLVSRQVYEEAFYVFCCSNAIKIAARKYRSIEGSLRLFPGRPANYLRHLEVRYSDYEPFRGAQFDGPNTSNTWATIVKEALIAKEYFPHLATYTALWDISWYSFFEGERMREMTLGSTKHSHDNLWLRWFRKQSEGMGVVPPPWVRVRLELLQGSYYRWSENGADLGPLQSGLLLFQEEVKTKMAEGRAELEESGKKWLEEEFGDGKRFKKGKGKDAV